MEKRIIELESRVSFQDDMVVQLNEVVIELRAEVAALAGRLKVAEEKLRSLTPELVVPQGQEEPPPHY